jgi:hypothetical protein
VDTEVEEKGPGDAPVWYNSREAIAWANGWNACMREMTQTQETCASTFHCWHDIDGIPRCCRCIARAAKRHAKRIAQ